MKKRIFPAALTACVLICLFAGCEQNDPSWVFSGVDNDNTTFTYLPECPAKVSNDNCSYITHVAKIGNRNMRNYTMCFDKNKYAALWVAYPLHQCYLGGSGRTEKWAFDPDIETWLQVDTSGYHTWNYTRGHQIPSADRTASSSMNNQTFYMSNMTPQGYDFNSGIWAALESRIRGYKCNDTLYVVTGAHWDDDCSYIKRKYPVPTHYYKVLLRTISGNTGKSVTDTKRSDLKCIGFWLEHSASGTINKSYCKSVAEIERLTGHTFFPDVDVDKTQCNPSDWGLR